MPAGQSRVKLGKGMAESRQVIGWDADAGIPDRQHQDAPIAVGLELRLDGNPPALRKFEGIRQELHQDLPQADGIRQDSRNMLGFGGDGQAIWSSGSSS